MEAFDGAMEACDGAELIKRLPPLPRPNLGRMRLEASRGWGVVLSTVAMCVGATETGVYYMVGWYSPQVIWTCRILVYVEAVVAIVCLLGLMLGDPGIVRRSGYTCLPLPEEVAAKLRNGEPVQPMENILQDGDVYCARCLLWRHAGWPRARTVQEELCDCFPSPNRIHHCSTCQRCVEYFDHHCAVFGRCIAGRGFGGNMGYFKVIIGIGYFSGCSSMIVLTIGLFRAGDVGYWLAVAFASYTALMCVATTGTVCFWSATKLWRTSGIWELRPCCRRRGWRGFEPVGGRGGTGSDIDVPPVDAVVIGSRR